MTISFFEPGDVPQPPEKVKIEHLSATVYPDLWRVGVEIHVTPFMQRPSLEIALFRKPEDKIVASLSIIETMHPKMEFTMHIRGVDDPVGDYNVKVALFFREVPEGGDLPPRGEPVDLKEVDLTISEEVSNAESE